MYFSILQLLTSCLEISTRLSDNQRTEHYLLLHLNIIAFSQNPVAKAKQLFGKNFLHVIKCMVSFIPYDMRVGVCGRNERRDWRRLS